MTTPNATPLTSGEKAEIAAELLRLTASCDQRAGMLDRLAASPDAILPKHAEEEAKRERLFAFALRLAASVLDPSDATAWLMGMPMLEGETRIAQGRAALNALVDSVKAGKDG